MSVRVRGPWARRRAALAVVVASFAAIACDVETAARSAQAAVQALGARQPAQSAVVERGWEPTGPVTVAGVVVSIAPR